MTDPRHPSDPPESDQPLSPEAEEELLAALALAQAPDDGLAAHDRAWAQALARSSVADEPEATHAELAALARGDDAEFLQALRAADAPAPLDPARHERMLQRLATPARSRPAWWAGSAVVALAAAALLAFRFTSSEAPVQVARVQPAAAVSRSTESIVASASAAGTSTRVDRIAQARSGDYRKNRFRSWGAR